MAYPYAIPPGTTSKIIEFIVRDSTTGQGKTGVAYTDVTASYVREGGTRTAITLASGTAGDAYSSGKWAEVDSTNCPGLYQLHIPNAALATGVTKVTITLKASGMIDKVIEISLKAINVGDDGIGEANVLEILNTDVDASPAPLDVNVVEWLGDAVATPTEAGVPLIELAYINGEAVVTTGTGAVTFAAGGTVAYTTGAVGSVTGTVGSVTGNVGGNVAGSVGSVSGNVGGNVVGSVGSVAGNVGGNVAGSVASVTNAVTLPAIPVGWITANGIASEAITSTKFAANAITEGTIDTAAFTTAKFDTAFLTANLIASDAITSAKIATDAKQAIATTLLDLTAGVETNLTPRQAFRLWTSALVGKSSNDGKTFRDYNDSKARITATVDADGNRTAVTTDAT